MEKNAVTEPLLVMAFHNHQPVGNFERVFDRAFRECYEPLLTELSRHPRFKFSLHFSGPLWEYMERREKASWKLTGDMAARGQAELLGGGFYEPILSIIPEEDRLDQLGLMQRFLLERFGVKARGVWLAERVWEPDLPRTLARAGIDYTLLDEEHFRCAGVADIHASYLTEDGGAPLRIFPIDKTLRYMIPFRPTEEVLGYLRETCRGGVMAVLGDDGEKFGLWPGTGRIVYQDRWLSRFLEALDREAIVTRTLAECLDAFPPRETVYLPPASYEEMMEWVLEPEEQASLKKLKEESPSGSRRFIRGGLFRDFFRKYPESNILHKRMLLASQEARPGKKDSVRRHVFMAQGNDPYWHGVFGGLYLPHLREAAYGHIIQAEAGLSLGRGWSVSDFDLDGRPEAIFRSEHQASFIKPSCGGSLVCLDSVPLGRNVLDVLSRRREAYHLARTGSAAEGKSIHELAKTLPPGTGHLTEPEAFRRYSMQDRFFAPDGAPEDLASNRSGEAGDFLGAEYDFLLPQAPDTRNSRGKAAPLLLSRSGHVTLSGPSRPLVLRKRILAGDDGLSVAFELGNSSPDELHFLFGSEWNFSAFPGEWEVEDSSVWFFERTMRLDAQRAEAVWVYPLQTLSQSETGFDVIHQGVCVIPVWRLRIPAGAVVTLELSVKLPTEAKPHPRPRKTRI